MSEAVTEKQKLAHELVHKHGSENYADLAKKCGVSLHVICRIFYTETGEHSCGTLRYVPRESTLDKIITGLSCALLALFIPTQSEAGASDRMSLVEGRQDCFAMIQIENRYGNYNQSEILQTELGEVVVRYRTVGAHSPGNDDYVEVVELPSGVFARPMRLDIPDGDKGLICLFEPLGM